MKSSALRLLNLATAVAMVASALSLAPSIASAAAVTLTSITATSTNALNTSYAKIGDTVNYQLTLSADPLILPQINIFNLGSTTMTNTGVGTYTYSTTTSGSNAWSQGAAIFHISVGGTTGAEATTTVTQASVATNVTYDTVAPGDPTGLTSGLFQNTESVTIASTGSSQVRYTTDGSTPTCSSGTVYSSAITIAGNTTLKAVGCDVAGNASSVVTAVYSKDGGANPATPATPAVRASGLSDSQITSILDVLASFNADAATVARVKASLEGVVTGSVTSAAVHAFKANLTLGSLGEEVRALQQFLNRKGYAVSSMGAGSFGNETTRFGSATKAALIKYQKAKGITPAVGYFGPKTRAAVEADQ